MTKVYYLPKGVQQARQVADTGNPVEILYGTPYWAQAADVRLYYGSFSENEITWAQDIDFMTRTLGLLVGAMTWKVVEETEAEPVTIIDITDAVETDPNEAE